MGLQTYRFSTSWSRVRPDGGALNAQGVDFYKRLTDELLDAGILPWLTLYHWDLPAGAAGQGRLDEPRHGRPVHRVRPRHARRARRPRERVDDAQRALVLVVPELHRGHCTRRVTTASRRACSRRTTCCSATGRRCASCARATRRSNLGITLNLTVAEPGRRERARPTSTPHAASTASSTAGSSTRSSAAQYPADIVEDIREGGCRRRRRARERAIRPGDLEAIATPIDTLGVNYYHGEFVGGHAPANPPKGGRRARPIAPVTRRSPSSEGIHWHERGLPRTPMHWEVQPEGLTTLLHARVGRVRGACRHRRSTSPRTAPRTTTSSSSRTARRASTTPIASSSCAATSARSSTRSMRASMCAATSTGRCSTTSSGHGGTRSDSASSASTTTRRSGRLKDSGREYARIIGARALDLESVRAAARVVATWPSRGRSMRQEDR